MTPWLVATAPSSDFVLDKLEGTYFNGKTKPVPPN